MKRMRNIGLSLEPNKLIGHSISFEYTDDFPIAVFLTDNDVTSKKCYESEVCAICLDDLSDKNNL